jgi:hypothetical protein
MKTGGLRAAPTPPGVPEQRVACHVIEGLGLVDAPPRLADHHGELCFVVEGSRFARTSDRLLVSDQTRRVLPADNRSVPCAMSSGRAPGNWLSRCVRPCQPEPSFAAIPRTPCFSKWMMRMGYFNGESLDRNPNSSSPSYVSAPTFNASATRACVTSLATLKSDSWASTSSPSAKDANAPRSTAALT